ncbi:MAG TPA: hypothetical protein VH186_10715 [Chloroflexia bacterium]|nr:hypothetical protein [Chloroflexia bacterium]
MPKKTSRSVRAIQAQRSGAVGGERKNAARPLVDLETSRLAGNRATNGTSLADDVEYLPSNESESEAESMNSMPESRGTVTAPRPSSSARRPYSRRSTTAANRQPAISREEEYAFIRADLLTVFLLTALMIIILVVLTFVIGH